jgi:hypothetical protein
LAVLSTFPLRFLDFWASAALIGARGYLLADIGKSGSACKALPVAIRDYATVDWA